MRSADGLEMCSLRTDTEERPHPPPLPPYWTGNCSNVFGANVFFALRYRLVGGTTRSMTMETLPVNKTIEHENMLIRYMQMLPRLVFFAGLSASPEYAIKLIFIACFSWRMRVRFCGYRHDCVRETFFPPPPSDGGVFSLRRLSLSLTLAGHHNNQQLFRLAMFGVDAGTFVEPTKFSH